MEFDGVKTFCATKVKERVGLGETITAWLRRHPEVVIVGREVTQSSDDAFHCLTVTLFYVLEGTETA